MHFEKLAKYIQYDFWHISGRCCKLLPFLLSKVEWQQHYLNTISQIFSLSTSPFSVTTFFHRIAPQIKKNGGMFKTELSLGNTIEVHGGTHTPFQLRSWSNGGLKLKSFLEKPSDKCQITQFVIQNSTDGTYYHFCLFYISARK